MRDDKKKPHAASSDVPAAPAPVPPAEPPRPALAALAQVTLIVHGQLRTLLPGQVVRYEQDPSFYRELEHNAPRGRIAAAEHVVICPSCGAAHLANAVRVPGE